MAAEHSRRADAALSEAGAEVARRLTQPSLRPAGVGVIAFSTDATVVALGLWFSEFLVADAGLDSARAGFFAAVSGLGTATAVLAAHGYRLTALRRFWLGWLMLAATAAGVAIAGTALGVWSGWYSAALPALVAGPARALTATVAGWVVDYRLTERRAVVVGGGAEAERLIRGLAANPNSDIRICGLFDDRSDARSPPVVIGTPKLGSTAELIAFARAAQIDIVIIALPLTAERRIREILDHLRILPVDVRLSAYSSDFSFRRKGDAAGLISVIKRPLEGWPWLLKRCLDLLVATAALIALWPVLLATAAAIKCESRGPVIFRQQRHGYNNRAVTVWKFRSMYASASDPTARKVVTRNDPRVTVVGRFIRRWSIDELPQLFNVLRGDLSLVGPRPHVLDARSATRRAFDEIVEGYAARHRVPPGITGWAQIHGWRGEVDAPEKLEARVAHDLYYIENWSIWLDLYILVVTPLRLLDARNAY